LSCSDPGADLITLVDLAPVTTNNSLNGYTCALN